MQVVIVVTTPRHQKRFCSDHAYASFALSKCLWFLAFLIIHVFHNPCFAQSSAFYPCWLAVSVTRGVKIALQELGHLKVGYLFQYSMVPFFVEAIQICNK